MVIPARPPGLSNEAYQAIMKKKRIQGNIVAGALTLFVGGLLVFPYFFVNFKNEQHAKTQLRPNVMRPPGQTSMDTPQWERENSGKF